ncbi:NAD+ synthetase [Thermincola ferriacetica]|uniref:Glutamine-dependent NAD(+) synthetase n=1 Tax=Thermincola ferriacetica TaxID=281456 RepID=A0A0L6W691_9FIRM|nr:NAD(+) synthase [Thermincola ferriacetica]KNZ71035.1 NAD+ synthetase [Thermincola ferriacetica]
MPNYGFVRVGAATPKLRVADPAYNISEILKIVKEADEKNVAVLVFPELSITGYTCADLFGQKLLLEKAVEFLGELLQQTETLDVLTIVGLPLMVEHKLFNCGVAVHRGRILGAVPKIHLPNYKEFYEKRWFTSGHVLGQSVSEINLLGQYVPCGRIMIKAEKPSFLLGMEICEDLWAVIPPSSYLALNGADIIANLSAGNELVSKADYRRQLILQQSARCMCGYIYASAGVYESTTDLVFGGHNMIAENGILLKESERFKRDSSLILSEIDVERLASERMLNKTYADNYEINAGSRNFVIVKTEFLKEYNIEDIGLERPVPPYPFVPGNPATVEERCREIFNIQVAGLAKRLQHTNMKHVVLGISGGLDSTLALLVTAQTFDTLHLPAENIIAITMPGFGTTDITYTNALDLMKALHVTIREIDIKPACLQHFKDIGHNAQDLDITYENVQARERTQILMDIANNIGGLVVGTGDLSELALGWATYNGDHMSMYSVNCSIPKTLVKFLVRWVADNIVNEQTAEVLQKVLNTPISPELLPPDTSGTIAQKTEDLIGPYELHDFFLYYTVRFGMHPKKVLFLADCAFKEKYSREEIKKWLKVFYNRFFSQQFKRSCLPDGPKVGTVSLSPRGDWRMPSDAEVRLWLAELD